MAREKGCVMVKVDIKEGFVQKLMEGDRILVEYIVKLYPELKCFLQMC
jgi:hypothetical protein